MNDCNSRKKPSGYLGGTANNKKKKTYNEIVERKGIKDEN